MGVFGLCFSGSIVPRKDLWCISLWKGKYLWGVSILILIIGAGREERVTAWGWLPLRVLLPPRYSWLGVIFESVLSISEIHSYHMPLSCTLFLAGFVVCFRTRSSGSFSYYELQWRSQRTLHLGKKRGEGRGLGLTPTSETCFFSSPFLSPVLKLFGIRAAKGHRAK